jgi:DNA polymerase I-like protein with 3'-5' exonuclease and polymerase domains
LDAYFPPGEARNVGILNGEPSGNTVDVDLDCPEALHIAPRLLPATGWVFGRGSARRSHWLYRVDRPLDTAQEKFTDLDGTVLLELRGTGGLTIYPPSSHKETGEPICWERFTDPAELPLNDLQKVVREVAAVSLLVRHWPSKGTRQDAFLALVGGLLRAGWDQNHTERFVHVLAIVTRDDEVGKRVQVVASTINKQNQDRKTTGWPKLEELIGATGKDVVRRVREWLGTAPKPHTTSASLKIRNPGPYQPFPVTALPRPLSEYVREGSSALGCDPAYLALPILSVAASVIGNTRCLRLKRGWEEPSVIWTAVVGDSGTLKSPAFLKAVSHLFRLQKRLLETHRQRMAEYRNELREYRSRKKEAEKNDSDPGDEPEAPILQRVVCSDTTIEKLAEILEDNPRGTLLARDELAGWIGSFSRYKGKGAGSDLPSWLEMHRAGTVVVDRKTTERKNIFIERAAVSVAGGIQPGVLKRALTSEFLDAGLAARILMAMPPRLAKVWTDAEISREVETAYRTAVDRLLELDFDIDEQGSSTPHVLSLGPKAKAVWVAFYNTWGREQADSEGELAAAFSKLEAYAARFALLHHVVERLTRGEDDRVPLEPASVEAGVALCRWFAREARRIYATLSETEEESASRKLVEFILARGGTMSVRELMRANCRRYPDSRTAESALGSLVDAGAARWVELPAKKKGKAGKAIELCMTHDTHDEDDSEDDPEAHDEDPDGYREAAPFSQPRLLLGPACDVMGPAADNNVMRVMRHAGEEDDGWANGHPEEPGHASATSSDHCVMRAPCEPDVRAGSMPPYLLIQDRNGLDSVAAALDNTALVGLDLETTGLDPREDRVRLLSLACDTVDGGTCCYLVDCFAVDPSPLWERLGEKKLVLHNAAFDLGFLARLGFTPPEKVHDTMLLAQLLTAGTTEKVNLAACCRRWLHRDLDKTEQKSDWSGRLTGEQLGYAALDVEVLAPLFRALAAEIQEAGLQEAAGIEQRCLPAVVWMARHGVGLDRDTWRSLATASLEEAERLGQELDRAVPTRPGELFGGWNWESTQQAQQALGLAGCVVENTADETLAAADHPLAQLLRSYRLARKRGGTYGAEWLKHVADDGRVYPGWRQLGAASGRMSCSDPNMQQLPRGKHRRCVVAPPGRALVKADYSQIELRIAAKVSGDKAMLEAYRRGDDLHTRTARAVLGIEEVTKQHRQLAKALNFGLLYGMGAKGFRQYAGSQYGLDLSEAEAGRYRDAFFRSYPGLAAWHRQVRIRKATETRTLTGRRRLLDDDTPDTHRLNTPVQGTGADGLKLALAVLWEQRDPFPTAFPVLAVHDEIVVECDHEQADLVADWLRTTMVDSMAPLLAPVPVEVETKIGMTWGEG